MTFGSFDRCCCWLDWLQSDIMASFKSPIWKNYQNIYQLFLDNNLDLLQISYSPDALCGLIFASPLTLRDSAHPSRPGNFIWVMLISPLYMNWITDDRSSYEAKGSTIMGCWAGIISCFQIENKYKLLDNNKYITNFVISYLKNFLEPPTTGREDHLVSFNASTLSREGYVCHSSCIPQVTNRH